MDLTIHLLTKNNASTIEKTLASIQPLETAVSITDLGSQDRTVEICRKAGYAVERRPYEKNRSLLLNTMVEISDSEWQLYLQPWEVVVQGQEQLTEAKQPCYHVSVLQNQILSKEIRLWRKSAGFQFANPIFEHLVADSKADIGLVLYSEGADYGNALQDIEAWKCLNPLASDPYYYQACVLLGLRRYEEFKKVSEHYMFVETKPSRTTTLNRYYYAMVQLIHDRKARPALQNLNLCLCHYPLMAEFWCLTGDVYYHLYNRFDLAKSFYENAIVLGARRLKDDMWPMDIAKYDEYPQKMIESCDSILKQRATFRTPK